MPTNKKATIVAKKTPQQMHFNLKQKKRQERYTNMQKNKECLRKMNQ